jgi:hypothetical protein
VEVQKAGYATFLRQDFLDILRSAGSKNPIVRSFLAHLEAHDAEINKYLTSPYVLWKDSAFAWIGLYEWLQSALGEPEFNWDYVANPRGGFMGAWWHFTGFSRNSTVYLQIEQGRLCFKLGTEKEHDDDERAALREEWRRMIEANPEAAAYGVRPARRSLGQYMTIATADEACWLKLDAAGVLDKTSTIERLSRAADLIDGTVQPLTCTAPVDA